MPFESPLLVRIDRYLRHTGMPQTRFGREAVGDPRLIRDMRNGRQLGSHLARRLDTFLLGEGW